MRSQHEPTDAMLRTAFRVAPAVRAACAPVSAVRTTTARSMSTYFTREHEYAKVGLALG